MLAPPALPLKRLAVTFTLVAGLADAASAVAPTAGAASLIRVSDRSEQSEYRDYGASNGLSLPTFSTATAIDSLEEASRIEFLPQESITWYRIVLDLESEYSARQAQALGVALARPGRHEYEISEEARDRLRAAGMDPEVLGGVTVHRFRQASGSGAAATNPPEPEGGPKDPFVATETGNFTLYSGITNDYIPDPGTRWRWIQASGGGAPPGSITTNLQYRLRIHNDSSPSNIYCGDYEIYLSSTTHGGAQPYLLVYNNLGARTDGGFDDDAENDSDIFLNLRGTQAFNGEDPNQQWYVYVKDTLSGDWGYLQYIEFKVYWQSPTFDLQATDIYLRTQPGNAGTRVDNPQAGQALYPHFTYALTGNTNLTGTIWRIQVDGSTTLCAYTDTIVPGNHTGWCTSPWTVPAGLHNLNGRADPNGTFSETNENNNDANRNYSVPLPQDLIAEDVYLRTQPGDGGSRVDNPQAGQALYPHFTFTLGGTTNFTGRIMRIQLDGVTTLCYYDGTITPGSYVANCTTPWTVTAGLHNLNGRVDPNGSFSETNENNNDANRNYSVAGNPEIRIQPLVLNFSSQAPQSAFAESVTKELKVPAGRPNPKRVTELMARARQEGSVRVIVRLRAAFIPEGQIATVTAIQEQRQAFGAVQESLLRHLAGYKARLVTRFQYIPFITLEVDPEALTALAGSPQVVGLEEDLLLAPSLASSIPVIGADQAWAAGYTGSGEVVAILDTGVDRFHPFFTTGHNKVVSEACYSSNNSVATSVCPGGVTESTDAGSGVPCSIAGCDHGTHVAGIAAGNDGQGPNFGVARDADLIAIQIFSRIDSTTECSPRPSPCARTYSTDQTRGLERVYTLRNSFNIAAVNMSVGGGRYYGHCDSADTAEKAAIDNLRSVGIATVIATGNDDYTDSINFPACISTAISVGATNDSDTIADFSNIASIIDLVAPGVSITSSVPGGGTGSKDGTSMATPHVTGAWALMKQANPNAAVDAILTTLRNSGIPVDDSRPGGNVQDIPRINVVAALQVAGPGQFTVFNDGTATLTISSIQTSPSVPWITWSPQAPFDVAPGVSRVVTVSVDLASAPPGESTYRLLVSSNDLDENPYPGGVFVVVTKAQCYSLGLTHTGSGSNPVAAPISSPDCPSGQYNSGQLIQLNAVPDPGWMVSGWTGTSNDASISTSNSLTMPPSLHSVAVHYQQVTNNGLSFYTVTPCRVLDTRLSGNPLISGTPTILPIVSNCGIPTSAKAVSFNVTIVGPTGGGHLTLYPGDESLPLASTINFRQGQVRANNAILRLGNNGNLAASATIAGGGHTHLILDVNGYFQ